MEKESVFYSDLPEITLAASLPRSKRTLMGQVFTPFNIAREMARWAVKHRWPATVLDPALGLGIFLRAILEYPIDPLPKMTGYEIDPDIASQAQRLFFENGCRELEIHTSSFLSSSWDSRFDAVLCNPPYRRFRGLPGKDELVKLVKSNTGVEISRAANLYVFFLVKAIHQIAQGGRAAFIIPYEFFNADYGREVKQYLLDEGVLRKVLILGEEIRPFDQVITTTCILCMERTPPIYPPEVQFCRTLEELSAAIDAPVDTPPAGTRPARPAQEKWLAPAILHQGEDYKKMAPLSTFGRVSRGIATGDNGYFMLTEQQRTQWELEVSSLLPCLSKSSFAPDHIFSSLAFERLVRSNKPVWLFQAGGNEECQAVKRYLAYGIERGTDRRYLTRMRTPWYALEERPPAPLLATTFSRNGIRWVRNEAGVRFLTTFHGFYPNPDTDLDLLAAYLLTPLAQQILAQNRREYGNGLHKFEPNDLNQGLVLDIFQIPGHLQKEIKEIYLAYLTSNQHEKAASSCKTELNRIFNNYWTSC